MFGAALGAATPFPFQEALLSGGLVGVYTLLALASFLKYTIPFLPGDLALLAGVFWVGVRHGSWGVAGCAIVLGGTFGAMTAYGWGRRFGALLLKHAKLARAEGRVETLLSRWGLWAIALNRFIPGARTLFLPVAGFVRMDAWRVAGASVVANSLFAALLVGLGYSTGREFSRLESLYHVYLTGFSSVLLFLGVGAFLYWAASKAISVRRERKESRSAVPEAEALP